ncbi:PD-(D/E)XK nuclease family protein [Halomicrobium urmianum]|uniref:PD-(D/E)XK nuclease family protein n=1 Tax=Halomicrobium urmianum TaxID=1586233 RepID=UPI001CD93F13|nr:PD-(D/E)XK nuclease family protein [Halomicrobium urmianum]
MPIQRAKSIDTLYDEVADYDLVVTPDAPLASAINRRVDVPQFGTFATTPRRLAAGRREQAEDRTAFLEVVNRTDHDWKSISYAVGNVLQCWEHQGAHDAIHEYEPYVDDATEAVVDIIGDLRTTSKRLGDYTINEGSVAVVAEDQLTELERSILPDSYDRVELFTDQRFDCPSFDVFESSADIVDAILHTVDGENAENVAVVLDSNSRYSSLVESALEAKDVPYYGGPGFVDRPHHRCFLTLCRSAFRGSETTVADIKPVLTQMGVDVGVDHDKKRLHTVDHPDVEWIQTFCESLTSWTFAEAVATYESRTGASMTAFSDELGALGLSERRIDAQGVDQLAYYLQTYEVPVDRENEGVLLADAKSASYVDRPVVFHVGLDEGWTHSPPRRPWIDVDEQFQQYIQQFQLLLQSGIEQYYLVQDTAGGQPVTPCLYFEELLDVDYDRFSDLEHESHTRTFDDVGEGFEKEPVDVEPKSITNISNSSLKRYVNSPRDYFFDRLLDGPDEDYLTEGSLFHDFAEFYVSNPGFVDEATIDEVADVLVDEVTPFFPETHEPLRRREYRIGLETIVEYLDSQRPFREDFLTPASGWGENTFAQYFDRPVDSPLTERWFEDASLGIKGQIDFVVAPDHLLDFKSGTKNSQRDMIKQAAIDPPADTPDFQAALYLCYYRTQRPDEPLEFTFFHFLETLDDVVTGDHDIEETLTTVSYYPWTFDEHVASREAFETLLDGWNDCEATVDDLGYDAYSEIMDRLSFPIATEKDVLRASTFAEEFTEAVDERTSDAVDAEKGCDQAIRILNDVRKKTFFREDLDAIEGFVQERIEELNRYRAGDERFPVDGPRGEPNYRRVDHRDLLLQGESNE